MTSKEDILEYMSQWIDEDKWDSLQCIYNAASVEYPGALEFMAHTLVCMGAIDSKDCFLEFREIQRNIIKLSIKYIKMSKKRKEAIYNEIFNNILTVECQDCNTISFVHSGNENIYPEIKQHCQECSSENLNIRRLKLKGK